jgi:hypothetical protein
MSWGNEALDEGMVAGDSSKEEQSHFNFGIFETQDPIPPEVSSLRERGIPRWMPENQLSFPKFSQKKQEKKNNFTGENFQLVGAY